MRPQSDPSPSFSSSSSSSSYDASQANANHNRESGTQSDKRTKTSNETRMLSRQPSANPLIAPDVAEDLDEGDYEGYQQWSLKSERYQLGTLQDRVANINRTDHFDLVGTLELFNSIKDSQKAMETLARHGNSDDLEKLRRFGGSISTCITKLERFLQTGEPSKLGIEIAGKREATNTLLESLSATEVRGLCNGLATVFDENIMPKLFSKAQLTKLGTSLRTVNDALMLQAMTAGLPCDLPSNGCLLDTLKLQSRLLKAKLLHSDSTYVRAIFARSIDIFGAWAATSGKVVSEDGKVVSRQLGKVFVQLNTIRTFGLIKLDKSEAGKKNRQILGELALSLGSAEALDELTSRPGPVNSNGPTAAPIRVPPNGVEVTNIGNTIKDFLDSGFISVGTPEAQQVLKRLLNLTLQIQVPDMTGRSAQTLGNSANLIRVIYECALRPGASPAILQSPEFSTAATHLLQLSASETFWGQVDWFGKPDQTLANIGSFIKAMDKWGKAGGPLMRSATLSWAAQLHALEVDSTFDGSSVASMLSAMVALHDLAPGAQLPALIEQLLGVASEANSAKWEGRSRALALRAALAWTPAKGSPNAGTAIDALLAAGPHQEDSLPYLQAILMRCKQDISRLTGFEKMLRLLLPQRPANDVRPIELSDIESEIKRRAAKEAPPAVREPEPVAPASAPVAETTEPKSEKRKLVGETSLIEKKVENTANKDSDWFTGSGKKDKQQDVAGYGKRADEWSQAKKTIRPPRSTASTTTLSSTVPKVTPRENTESIPRKPELPGSSVISTSTAAGKNSAGERREKNASDSAAKSTVKSDTTKNTGVDTQQHAAPASVPLNAKNRAALEKQWFDAIRNPGLKARMAKLEEMFIRDTTLSTREDKNHQPPLFYAITNGDKNLVEWLLDRMDPKSKNETLSLLPLIFTAPVLAGNEVIAALNAFLSRLDKSVVIPQLKQFFSAHRASTPPAYVKVLESFLPKDSLPQSQNMETAIKPTKSSEAPHRELTPNDLDKFKYPASAENSDLLEEKKEVIRELGLIMQEKGSNPLLSKIYLSDLNGVEELLKHPKAPSLLSTADPKYGMTPLALASFLDRPEVVEKILKSPAGLNSAITINRLGYTPLQLAIEWESVEALRALLKAPNAPNQIRISRQFKGENTSVYMAVYGKKPHLLRMLLEVPGTADLALLPGQLNLTPLQLATVNDDAACAAELLKLTNAGKQLRVTDKLGRNVLGQSLQEKSLSVGKLLLQRPEAAKLIREHFSGGMNALTFATSIRDEKTVELLLASPYAEWLAEDDSDGKNNALMISTLHPNAASLRIAERLLSLPNAERQAMTINPTKQNALLMATEKGLIDLVRKLISLPNAKIQTKVRRISMIRSTMENPKKENAHQIMERLNAGRAALSVIDTELRRQNEEFPVPPGVLRETYTGFDGMNAFELTQSSGQIEIAKLLQPFENSLLRSEVHQ